jgi:hypothetical protein
MFKITVERPSQEELEKLGVRFWNTWGGGEETFEWEYSRRETCYVLEGAARIKTPWEEAVIAAGDLVTFPKGLTCVWTITKPIKKVYKFD